MSSWLLSFGCQSFRFLAVEQSELQRGDDDRERGNGNGVQDETPDANGVTESLHDAINEQNSGQHRREVLAVEVSVVLAGRVCCFDVLDGLFRQRFNCACACHRFSCTQRHRKYEWSHECGMPIQSYSHDSHQDSKELIHDAKRAGRSSLKTTNKPGSLLLQAVTFRKTNRRQCQNKKSHQAIIRERAAKHVDDSFLTAGLCQVRQALKHALVREQRQSCEQARYDSRYHYDHSRSQAQSKSYDDDGDARQL